MSEYPKVTVIPNPDGDPKVLFDEDEFPRVVWDIKVQLGFGTPTVTLEIPASAVEFKRVD